MQKIHKLSPETIAKIAAGEVIERPSFVVKELIENAIDAHATEISLSIEDAGLQKIQITDNGEGMSQEDVEECWKPHTTSKLTESDTLVGIKSFGFRGEALASLAVVSTLTIKSRTDGEDIGTQIEIKDGKMIKSIPVGMPRGTTVIAENLFSHIPARKKFLKSTQTEFRHIVEVVNYFALAYPDIRLFLQHNHKIVLDFPQYDTFKERVTAIVGNNTSSLLLPLQNQDSYLSIKGYIAKPQLTLSTQSRQILFINKRKVTDKLISLAIKEAFGTMLEANVYPYFILFLDFPYEMVDVNVHPRKEQVVFLNNQDIFQKVKEIVHETLQANNITFQNISWKRMGAGTTNSFAGKLLKQTVLEKEKFHVAPHSPFIQIMKLYIFSQTKKGIMLTDQHAAHERILFEKLKKEFIKQKRKNKSFQLKEPLVLHLSAPEHLLLKEYKKIFQKLGFNFYFSSKHSKSKKINTGNTLVIVTHVPFLFQDREPEELIKQFLENIEQDIPLRTIDRVSEEMLAFLACRSAVKAGDSLTEAQMKQIIRDLEKTENNATCPHGRPTQMSLSLDELHHLFKR